MILMAYLSAGQNWQCFGNAHNIMENLCEWWLRIMIQRCVTGIQFVDETSYNYLSTKWSLEPSDAYMRQ